MSLKLESIAIDHIMQCIEVTVAEALGENMTLEAQLASVGAKIEGLEVKLKASKGLLTHL